MKHLNHKRIAAALAAAGLLAAAAPAYAQTANSASQTATQQRLTNIKSRGDKEISRRLDSLSKLDSKISSAKHLSSSDQSALEAEVNSEISGLNSLKTKLDSETTLAGAITDAKSIISDYRVYALVLPKAWLVKTADDQQTVESKLTALIAKFQTRINAAKSQGKEVSALQSALDDMTAKANDAQAISSSIESKVTNLQPSDYNSDHSILSGDRGQLETAHSDNQTAISDAKSIVQGLKNL